MNPSIEQTIDRVEQLYATITGHTPPVVEGNGSRIPPESDPARHVEDQLGRLLVALEQRLAPPERVAQTTWTPRAVVWQDDSGFELAVDVSGVPRDRLELWLEGGALIVRGERPAPSGERAPIACELPCGPFARTFALPEPVEKSHVTARLEAGLLRVRIPRRAQVEPSQIPISCS